MEGRCDTELFNEMVEGLQEKMLIKKLNEVIDNENRL